MSAKKAKGTSEKPNETVKAETAATESSSETKAAENVEIVTAAAEAATPEETAPVETESDDPALDETDKSVEEPIVKTDARKVRVREFFGSYKDVRFDDHGVCENISPETLAALKADFPGAEIEEID